MYVFMFNLESHTLPWNEQRWQCVAVVEHIVFRHFFKSSSSLLDGFYEEDDVVAIGLGEVAELLDGPTCITLCISVPHDGFERVAGTAIVQTVFSTRAEE